MKEETNMIVTNICIMFMNYSAELKVWDCQDCNMLFYMEIYLLSQ